MQYNIWKTIISYDYNNYNDYNIKHIFKQPSWQSG